MNLFYPKIRTAIVPAMLGVAVLGAMLAGLYGIVHDEITFSISPEYFTRLKFLQFRHLDFGLPPRVFVGEIGFIAAGSVGLICGWFIARVTIPAFPRGAAFRHSLRGFVIILACAFAGSGAGYVFSILHGPDYSAPWVEFASVHGVKDLPGFVRVAYIHNAGYLGGFPGLVVALLYLRMLKTRCGHHPPYKCTPGAE